MRQIALVSLDCETGRVNRYLSYGDGPELTGHIDIEGWNPLADVCWQLVWEFLQNFRIGYCPSSPPDIAA